ncbi:DUF4268 domain-containing protein [Desulfobulbus sp.]|uniref:DUF4268 domain-containing protein n=1 Tax=Desulfobulbus sp. TaxID=895 RepID=UPI0027B93433|nr:DUF4268 domain-containing protein [Desulfobulbus sp.]
MAATFGLLERVTNIRAHWPREDTDFTPWLAAEDNIGILGDAIGIELEVLDQERNVGQFRADILCKNSADNTLVLIENQFAKTDHSHLGQLFTYAAGLDAVTLIWIVETFTDEHRAALDWLNRITHDKFHFFGIEIELWKIGDSPPAPKFNIVSKPNEWAKTIKESAEASHLTSLTPWQELQFEFWKQFGTFITANNSAFKPPKPAVTSWMGYGIGRAYTTLIVTYSKNEAWVYVQLDNKERATWFRLLQQDQLAIDAEFEEELIWEERPDLKYSRIRMSIVIDMTDQNNWTSAFSWMLKNMTKMKAVFKPRIKAISGEIAMLPDDNGEQLITAQI